MRTVKDCSYPNCEKCIYDDCIMDGNDISAMLKRRRWQNNPEKYRQTQRNYRRRVVASLPHCNECKKCILVKNDKGDGVRRLCIEKMRLIERKVTNSPRWCSKRKVNN